MRRSKYEILKILYYVIRVHRFEYYFVVYSCSSAYKVPLSHLFHTAIACRSTHSLLVCAQLCSLHNFLIRDTAFGRISIWDRPTRCVVVHRCTQNAICVFGYASATIQHPPTFCERGSCGALHDAMSGKSVSTKSYFLSHRMDYSYSRCIHSPLEWRRGCSTLK